MLNPLPANQEKTVKISNVSLSANLQDIEEFFSFSSEIDYVELRSGDASSQVAYVTFKDTQGADTALLLSGAIIVDLSVVITPATDYELPPNAVLYSSLKDAQPMKPESAAQKAEDVISSMLAKGFILGKGTLEKAKHFDEKHQLTSKATAKASEFDKKIGLSDKISIGTSVVSEKVFEMDSKYQVSEKAKSAIAVAEQTVSGAGSAIMKNKYVFSSAAWMTGALGKVIEAANDVGTKTMEKVAAEQENKAHLPETSSVSVTVMEEHPKELDTTHDFLI